MFIVILGRLFASTLALLSSLVGRIAATSASLVCADSVRVRLGVLVDSVDWLCIATADADAAAMQVDGTTDEEDADLQRWLVVGFNGSSADDGSIIPGTGLTLEGG